MQPVILKRSSIKREKGRLQFLMRHYRKGKILDLGNIGGLHGDGGSGFHERFTEAVTESEVYGFDICEPKEPEAFKNQQQGDLEETLPYPDQMFDTVYMGELIEHLTDFKQALREIRRVLKADGVLIIDTPNAYSIHRICRYFLKREEHMGNATHTLFFTPASLIATLKREGFKVDEIAVKGFLEITLCAVFTKDSA